MQARQLGENLGKGKNYSRQNYSQQNYSRFSVNFG
jgi:hypothetical protein